MCPGREPFRQNDEVKVGEIQLATPLRSYGASPSLLLARPQLPRAKNKCQFNEKENNFSYIPYWVLLLVRWLAERQTILFLSICFPYCILLSLFPPFFSAACAKIEIFALITFHSLLSVSLNYSS
jgi:hypothetical protein